MKKKMKGIMIGFLTLLVLSPALVFSEVTLKKNKGPDGTTQTFFYSGGKKIAEQINSLVRLARQKYFKDKVMVKLDTTIHEQYKTGQLDLFN